VVDDWVHVDNEEAFSRVGEILANDRLLVSPSSATVYACMDKYNVLEGACVVGIFADDGRKFRSVYSDLGVMSNDEFDSALEGAMHVSVPDYE